MDISIRSFLFQNIRPGQIIFKNTFWLTLAEIIARLLNLVLVIYMARILGATEYGKFAFALSFVSIASFFSDLGIIDASTKEFSRDKENEKKFSSIFTLEIILSILTLIITVISSFFITSEMYIRKMIWALIIFALNNSLFGVLFSFLRARQKMEYEAMVKIFHAILNVGAVFFVIFYFPTAINISYGYLLSSLAVLALFLFFFSVYFQPIKINFEKNIFKILKKSWPLSLGFMAGWIYISINSVMLGYFGLITENGWYNAASRIAIAAMIIANLVVKSFYPLLSNLFFTSKEKIQKVWNYLAKSMIFLVIPIVIGGLTLAQKIIYSFYGQGFSSSIFALELLIFVIAIGFINYPYTIMLVVADKQKSNFVLMIIGAGINIALNFILIPIYDFYGTIIATIIASLFVLFSTVFLSKKFGLIVPFDKKFFETAAISFLSGFLMYLVVSYKLVYNLNIIFTCLIGAASYAFASFLLHKIIFHQKLTWKIP